MSWHVDAVVIFIVYWIISGALSFLFFQLLSYHLFIMENKSETDTGTYKHAWILPSL